MTTVAIHQPNYLPWLGYFAKIARADAFVFLDDAQFTKGGYTNRVRILSAKGPRWLTVPVAVSLGDAIDRVRPSATGWPRAHLDLLRNEYRKAACFKQVLPDLSDMLLSVPEGSLAEVNAHLVRAVARRLGLSCSFLRSSELGVAGAADDRLVEITAAVAPGGSYLSGQGGARYQDPEKFKAAGLGFAYLGFAHPSYAQGAMARDFVPGLSVLDAAMHLGWEGAAHLVGG